MHDPSETARSTSGTTGSQRIDRRRLVGMTSAALAAPLAPGAIASAQGQRGGETPAPGSPIASPAAPIPVDVNALLTLSAALVGSDALNEDAVGPLADLIGGSAAQVAGFEELVQLDDPTSEDALAGISDDARSVVTNILQYWYLGQFDGQPVEHREAIFFALPVWQTVPYSTQPTLCKAFGYWATDPGVEDA